MNLSIVIPLINEADSLRELHREIVDVAQREAYDVELIFVDDGSDDSSWEIIQQLAAEDSRVEGIRFRRNFGKAAAISAGAEAASADVIITMDADLQDDPGEIPKLVAKLDAGFDVVSGWKQVRRDPLSKRAASKIFNFLVNRLTRVKLHDHNCGFKAYRRAVFGDIRLYGELHRFVPVLASAQGYQVGEVAVNHRHRKHGRSKYGSSRIVKGFLDLLTVSLLTGFNHRPQHLLGFIGLISFSLGMIGLGWMATYWILRTAYYPEWTPLHQRPLVIYSLGALLLGAQMLSMGFLAELIVARNSDQQKPYSIKSRTRNEPSDSSPASLGLSADMAAKGASHSATRESKTA